MIMVFREYSEQISSKQMDVNTQQANFIAKKKVAIVGLGYVGIPLASACAPYYSVLGFDIDVVKVESINKGSCPIKDDFVVKDFVQNPFPATTDFSQLSKMEIIVVCVPTPIDSHQKPQLTYLESASTSIAKNLQKGQLIIIESTIYPGTTEEVLVPILEKESGLIAGVDFGVAYCPERVDPGNTKYSVSNIARVLSSYKASHNDQAVEFYSKFIDAQVVALSSIRAAEAVKILENTFRDVNIAFINEMAQSFDVFGIDIHEVIRGAATKPFGFMPFYPGPGVGGHCIPVDPYYLIEKAKDIGFKHSFLAMAREINNSMPRYVIRLIQDGLNDLGLSVKGTKIGILGLSYKKNVGDLRGSPGLEIQELLRKKGADTLAFDPYVPEKSTVNSARELLAVCDVILIACDHDEFKTIAPFDFSTCRVKMLLDCKNLYNHKDFLNGDLLFRKLGGL